MPRRTRAELEAENLVLYRELEAIRDQLDELLEEDEVEPGEEEVDDSDGDDEEPDADDED